MYTSLTLVFSLLVVGCLCQDNTTVSLNATTLAPAPTTKTTTTLAPAVTNETMNATTAQPPQTEAPTTTSTTTTTLPPNTTTTTTTTEMPSTTTTTTQATKKVGCTSELCPPYSLCENTVCLMKCPNVTKPFNASEQVCGDNGKTYDSLDALKMSSCMMKQMITKKHDGMCKDSEEEEGGSQYVVIVVVLVLVLIIVLGIAGYWIYSKRRTNSKNLKDGDKSGDNLL